MPTALHSPSGTTIAGRDYRDRNYTFPVAIPGQDEYEITVRMPSRTALSSAIQEGARHIEGVSPSVRIEGLTWASTDSVRLAELGLSDEALLTTEGSVSRFRPISSNDLTARVLAAVASNGDAGAIIASEALLEAQSALGVVEDYSIFQSMYREVGESLSGDEAHKHPVYIETGFTNAFHLMGVSDPRGRSLGLEIEVDFPNSVNWGQERSDLAFRLNEAGLSRHSRPLGWHYAARGGERYGEPSYSDDLSTWTVEADSSVDGVGGARGCEIVSPILYNTPEVWEAVKKVVDIVNDLGGKVTSRTGLHVNIGAGDFDTSLTNAAALTDVTRRFDDVMVRLSHSPEIGHAHRGRHYCHTPATIPSHSRRDPYYLLAGNGHHSAVNLTHIPQPGGRARNSSRVEFRLFDGTLDMGRLQMNVELCMALMAYAVTHAGGESYDDHVVGGHHHSLRNGRPARRLTGAEFRESTLEMRTFLDTLRVDETLAEKLILAYRTSRWQSA